MKSGRVGRDGRETVSLGGLAMEPTTRGEGMLGHERGLTLNLMVGCQWLERIPGWETRGRF